jgi:hypothetical protein
MQIQIQLLSARASTRFTRRLLSGYACCRADRSENTALGFDTFHQVVVDLTELLDHSKVLWRQPLKARTGRTSKLSGEQLTLSRKRPAVASDAGSHAKHLKRECLFDTTGGDAKALCQTHLAAKNV